MTKKREIRDEWICSLRQSSWSHRFPLLCLQWHNTHTHTHTHIKALDVFGELKSIWLGHCVFVCMPPRNTTNLHNPQTPQPPPFSTTENKYRHKGKQVPTHFYIQTAMNIFFRELSKIPSTRSLTHTHTHIFRLPKASLRCWHWCHVTKHFHKWILSRHTHRHMLAKRPRHLLICWQSDASSSRLSGEVLVC